MTKHRVVSTVIRHNDVITCLSLDSNGNYVISGSKDTTSIVWEVYSNPPPTGASADGSNASGGSSSSGDKGSQQPFPRPIQVQTLLLIVSSSTIDKIYEIFTFYEIDTKFTLFTKIGTNFVPIFVKSADFVLIFVKSVIS